MSSLIRHHALTAKRSSEAMVEARPRQGRLAFLTFIAVWSMFAVSPSLALADHEPNDGITQAEGPLSGGVTYTGAIANENDLDTYVFYVSGQQQIAIRITATAEPGPWYECLDTRFGNSNNEALNSEGSLGQGQSAEFNYSTPPGVTRYYLELYGGCSGATSYSFTITPANAVVPGPTTLPRTSTGEPNENAAEALGPLTGNVAYEGELQTQNDQDWFKFYTAPGVQQVDVAYTALSPGWCRSEGSAQLQGPNVGESYTSFYYDEWRHVDFTSQGAGVYYISLGGESNCIGESYEFVIEPASALSSTPPGAATIPVARAVSPCVRARRQVGVRRRRYRRLIRSMHRASGAKRSRLHRAAARARLEFLAARAHARAVCYKG